MIKATGLHHVGLTVRDLDASLKWYQETLGASLKFVAEGSGEQLGEAVGVPDARLRFAFVQVGTSSIELLEYDNNRDTSFTRRNCDVGVPHICIHVPDIEAAYAELAGRGVRFYSRPFHIEGGPLDGCAFVYFPDPDGITLELFQTPDEQLGSLSNAIRREGLQLRPQHRP